MYLRRVKGRVIRGDLEKVVPKGRSRKGSRNTIATIRTQKTHRGAEEKRGGGVRCFFVGKGGGDRKKLPEVCQRREEGKWGETTFKLGGNLGGKGWKKQASTSLIKVSRQKGQKWAN